MVTQIVKKTKSNEDIAPRGGALMGLPEFPFFLSRMRDEFDRLFERFSQQWPIFSNGNGWRWGLKVRDEENTVIVEAEAPGFEAGDFDIHVSENRLILKASKKTETKGKEGNATDYQEQEYYESVTLPAGIDREKVDAKYHNGMLTVTFPKTATGKARRVVVKNA